jgi:hypothetical protein
MHRLLEATVRGGEAAGMPQGTPQAVPPWNRHYRKSGVPERGTGSPLCLDGVSEPFA